MLIFVLSHEVDSPVTRPAVAPLETSAAFLMWDLAAGDFRGALRVCFAVLGLSPVCN